MFLRRRKSEIFDLPGGPSSNFRLVDGLGESWDEREESNDTTDLSGSVELNFVVTSGDASFWGWTLFPIGVLLIEFLGGIIVCESVDCGKGGCGFAEVSLGICSASLVGFVAENSGFEGREEEVGVRAKTLDADRSFSVD